MLPHFTQIPTLASANVADNEIEQPDRPNISFSIGGLYSDADEADEACTYSLFPDCYPSVPLLCWDLVSHSKSADRAGRRDSRSGEVPDTERSH